MCVAQSPFYSSSTHLFPGIIINHISAYSNVSYWMNSIQSLRIRELKVLLVASEGNIQIFPHLSLGLTPLMILFLHCKTLPPKKPVNNFSISFIDAAFLHQKRS